MRLKDVQAELKKSNKKIDIQNKIIRQQKDELDRLNECIGKMYFIFDDYFGEDEEDPKF